MARRRPRTSERFAMLPLSIMTHVAFKTLPVGYQRVLWLMAAQYDGTNNGDLSLTRRTAREHFGLNNERHRTHGLRELEKRGFIEKTRQGGVANGAKHPTLWALTWHAVQHLDGKRLGVVRLPSHAYSSRRDQSTHVASNTTRTQLAVDASDSTHVASSDPGSTTRTLIAPSENLGVSPPSTDGVH